MLMDMLDGTAERRWAVAERAAVLVAAFEEAAEKAARKASHRGVSLDDWWECGTRAHRYRHAAYRAQALTCSILREVDNEGGFRACSQRWRQQAVNRELAAMSARAFEAERAKVTLADRMRMIEEARKGRGPC